MGQITTEQARNHVTRAAEHHINFGDNEVFDIAILSSIIDQVLRVISVLCGGVSATQTAQAMKSPTRLQRIQQHNRALDAARDHVPDDFVESIRDELDDGRNDDESRPDWRTRRRDLKQRLRTAKKDLKRRRNEYATAAVLGMEDEAKAQPVEVLAETVEAYRREESV